MAKPYTFHRRLRLWTKVQYETLSQECYSLCEQEFLMRRSLRVIALTAGIFAWVGATWGHGNVTPQAVDTTGLPVLGADWLKENPYRDNVSLLPKAIEIGEKGYYNNCAACHGLEAVSGGVAPDLRELEEGKFGDEWFMERTRKGYTQNGQSKMAGYEGIVSQEAMWAIRSYIESRPR
jgi:cytochrome c-550 PedF